MHSQQFSQLSLFALTDMPLVAVGDDINALLETTLARLAIKLRDGDVLVIAQKIISKAEDRYVVLDEVTPSTEALEWAQRVDKDPRLVQLILDESVEVV